MSLAHQWKQRKNYHSKKIERKVKKENLIKGKAKIKKENVTDNAIGTWR